METRYTPEYTFDFYGFSESTVSQSSRLTSCYTPELQQKVDQVLGLQILGGLVQHFIVATHGANIDTTVRRDVFHLCCKSN